MNESINQSINKSLLIVYFICMYKNALQLIIHHYKRF